MIHTILLAGGESTRFWPLKQKNLTRFFGKPLLMWHYEQFVRIGIKHVTVVANKESIRDIQKVPVPKKLTVDMVSQEGKGQVHAVFAAGTHFGEDPALILNASDIYEDTLLKEILDSQKKNPEALIMACVRVTSYFPGGYLKLKEDGSIEEIIEKPKEGKEPSDIVNLVVDIIPNMKKLCVQLKTYKRFPDDGYERALNKLIKIGTKAYPLQTFSQWLYLKYPWHTLSVMDACLSSIQGQHIDPSAEIGNHVLIKGPVIIEKGVKINEFTKIVGPVYIGEGTIIGNNNIIRHSHIGSQCVTGFGTDITRSYIGDYCWFHSNYIGDSVISSDVSMGAGSVLANLRLDESPISTRVKEEGVNTKRVKLGAMIGTGVRIGVNVSVMPGVKIGKNSFIGAGVVLGEDMKDCMYCRATPTVIISQNLKKPENKRDEFKKNL